MKTKIRILHTGDWHLRNSGMIAGKSVWARSGEYNQRLVDAKTSLDEIVDYAQTNEVDIIVVAGDVFDYPKPEKEAIKVAVDTVDGLANTAPVVIVRGNSNHDGGGSTEQISSLNVFRNRKTRFEVIISDIPESIPLYHPSCQIQLFTLPYPPKHVISALPQYKHLPPEAINGLTSDKMVDIVRGFHGEIDKGALNLLVGHFTVGGGKYSEEQIVPLWDVSVPKDDLERFDVVCLGHLHMSQEWYCGAIAQGGFGDEGMEPGFRVVEYDVLKREVVKDFRVPVSHRRYKTVNVRDLLVIKLDEDPEMVVRVKGEATREEYQQYLEVFKGLPYRFARNSVEIVKETRARCEAIAADMGSEEAFEEWLKVQEETKGYMNRKDRLLLKVRTVEEKMKEASGAE